MLLFGCTIFLSAFLLFQVQPMIAKIILPWFGGTAAVWATCLLFFQVVLLLGYLYAHNLINRLAPRRQFFVHAALLALSLLLLPVTPDASWKPSGQEDPSIRILLLLGATIGLPYFMLSTTGPLIQAWYVQANPGSVPYRLFALSNLGSMLALLSYPPLIEPTLTLNRQTVFWSIAFGVFAILCGITGWRSTRQAARQSGASRPVEEVANGGEVVEKPTVSIRILWAALATCPSLLLLAVTNHLTQDVAPIPFLWILPLALYLLSFILCFDAPAWYRRVLFLALSAPALSGMAYLIWRDADDLPGPRILIPLFAAAFFVVCMVCHGELSRLKPHPRYLTGFYLMLSTGGALGGVFVALVAPNLFNAAYELPIGLALVTVLIVFLLLRDRENVFGRDRLGWPAIALTTTAAFLVGFVGRVMVDAVKDYRLVARNFYGELRVRQSGNTYDWDTYRTLVHGAINHGEQYTHPARRKEVVTYYCPDTAVGRFMAGRAKDKPQKVAIIGLGTGTLAAYGRKGDSYKIYEINPLVQKIANTEFTYLKDSEAAVSIVLGDARLSLEREPPQGFDLIAVDAFSSDSIPVHLLTKEAIALYFRHLAPDGMVAVHISNRYIDLQPVLERAATSLGKASLFVETEEDGEGICYGTSWVALANDARFFSKAQFIGAGKPLKPAPWLRTWTDDFSNLYQVLK